MSGKFTYRTVARAIRISKFVGASPEQLRSHAGHIGDFVDALMFYMAWPDDLWSLQKPEFNVGSGLLNVGLELRTTDAKKPIVIELWFSEKQLALLGRDIKTPLVQLKQISDPTDYDSESLDKASEVVCELAAKAARS